MSPSSKLLLLVFLGASSFAAQSQAQIPTARNQQPSGVATADGIQTQNSIDPRIYGCPVSFRAQHSADGSMIAVRQTRPDANVHQKGPGQFLHLIVTNPRSGQVTGATVVLRGFSGKGRMAQTDQQDSYDLVRTQHVEFSSVPAKEVSTDLYVPGMTSVQLVQITSLTYADGSTWKLDAPGSCRATPEMFMHIAKR